MQVRQRSTFIILFIAFSINLSTAQDSLKIAEEQGTAFYNKGFEFYESNDIDSALIYCQKAADKYKEAQNWTYYVHTLTDITTTLYESKRFLEFKKMALFTNEESLKFLSNDNPTKARALNSMSLYFYALGNYEKTVEVSKEMLDLNIKHKAEKIDIASSYLMLGNAYKFLEDFDNAFSYIRKALDIQKTINPLSLSVAKTYQDIGLVFKFNTQVDSAIYYFELAEKLYLPLQNTHPSINRKGDNFLSLAELWNEKNNTTIAKKYIAKSQKLPLNQYYQIKREEIQGKIFYSQENYSQAILAFKKGQKSAMTYSKRNSPPYIARRYIQLALAYKKLGDFKKSLEAYQQGLNALSLSSNDKNIFNNPDINQLLDKFDALSILNGKANILYKLYLKTEDKKYLEASFFTYQSASELIKNFRQIILNTESKKELSQKAIEVYGGAIKVAIELFIKTNDPTYKESALSFTEANKAQLLLENFNEQAAKEYAGIPDSLLEQEKNINFNIAYLEKTIIDSEPKDISLKDLKNELFDLKQDLESFVSNLEKKYPRYHKLKYQNDPLTLSNIQQKLKGTNQAFLEYFIAEDIIYLFVISSSQVEILKIDNEALVQQNVSTIRNIINKPPDNSFDETALSKFTSTANQLYTQLLHPAIEILDPSIKNIIIIPDYYLNHIPFDILISNKENSSNNSLSPHSIDYFFEDFNISYDYSNTLHFKNTQEEKKNYALSFAGFAPSFNENKNITARDCSSSELYSLNCSDKEIQSIHQITGGKAFFGEQANRKSFDADIKSCKIIHLATHACIDEQNSNLNKIFLTDDYLSDFDLYNMDLNAELAVLSACNTGSGKLIKGEGIMSLARGFINAGCSSTVMSMWSVDDCATSDIMIYFYEGLEEGFKKSEALKLAKIKYLNSVDKSKMHPYYWAAFVPFGDMEAMEIGEKSNRLYYLFPISFLLFFVFLFIKRKSNKPAIKEKMTK